MRKLQSAGSRKKTRGMRRKCREMVREIYEGTNEFPCLDYDGNSFWGLKPPFARYFIESSRTPHAVRRLCVQTLIDRAAHLVRLRPPELKSARVVVVISLPEMWSSELIVFFDGEYFANFFRRTDSYQQWKRLRPDIRLTRRWNLRVPDNFLEATFYEKILDDGYRYSGIIWAIGELNAE